MYYTCKLKKRIFLVGFLHYLWRPTRRSLDKQCRTAIVISRTVIWINVPPSFVVLKLHCSHAYGPYAVHCIGPYVDAFCMHARGRKTKYVAVRPRAAMYGVVSRRTLTQDTRDAIYIYVSEQVSIGWRRTGACYTDKLTFSQGSSIKVWGTYYTNMRIIFELLRYFFL